MVFFGSLSPAAMVFSSLPIATQPVKMVCSGSLSLASSDSSGSLSIARAVRSLVLSHDCAGALLKDSDNGRLRKGALQRAAELFNISKQIVSRIWKQAKDCLVNGRIVNVSNRLVGRVGRKRIQIHPHQISEIPLRRRTNIRSLAIALNTPKSTVHRRIKEGLMRPHSNALKPYLTDENKKARLKFCVSMIDPDLKLMGDAVME